MSEKFTASNRVEVETDVHGCVTVTGLNSLRDESQALREFFLHERDQELGRWRWPENPDFVVYGGDDSDAVWAHNEREAGAILSSSRKSGCESEEDYYAASRAYFDAHPEKKTWHDAKPGEVWELTTNHIPNKVTAWSTFEGVFLDHLQNPVFGSDILAARRIWPESKES